MEKTDLILFNKEKTEGLLSQFDFKVINKKGDKQKIIGLDGELVQCHTCEADLNVNKVGTIAHGSRLIFCKNPLCFATWVAEKKLQ